MDLSLLDTHDETAWDEYARGCPTASHSHLSAWRRVVRRVYGHRTFYLLARENGTPRGILPLVLIRSLLFGRSLVSLPFLDDGGICADTDAIREELYARCRQLGREHKADVIDLRHRFPNSLAIPANPSKVTLTLELAEDADGMWKAFNAKLRNQIRKAMKSGLSASWHGAEGLAEFYEVFATNMRDLGSPVHSRSFFSTMVEEFPDSVRLLLVRKDARVIGGGLCVVFRDTMAMPWASSRRDCFALCPNNLLYWEALRWAIENNYRVFDFGRSSRDSGTYRFKRQWGAVERPLHWQCLSKRGDTSATLRTEDPTYRWAIRAWSSLPVSIANLVGPRLRGQMSN